MLRPRKGGPKGIRVDTAAGQRYKNSKVDLEVDIAAAEPTSGTIIGAPHNSDALAGAPRPARAFAFRIGGPEK